MKLETFIHLSNVLVRDWNQVNDLFRQIINDIADLKIDVTLHRNYIDGRIQFFLRKYEILIENIYSILPESLEFTAEQTRFKQLLLNGVKGKKERTTGYIQQWYAFRLAELEGTPVMNMSEIHTLVQIIKIEINPVGEITYQHVSPTPHAVINLVDDEDHMNKTAVEPYQSHDTTFDTIIDLVTDVEKSTIVDEENCYPVEEHPMNFLYPDSLVFDMQINSQDIHDNYNNNWFEEQLWSGFTAEVSSFPHAVAPVVENHHFASSHCENGGEYQSETSNMPYEVTEGVVDLSPHYQVNMTKAMPFQFFNAEKPSQNHEDKSSLKLSL